MYNFQISENGFLSKCINGFYHVPYAGMGSAGNPDYLNILKNTYNSYSQAKLQSAAQRLLTVLKEDFIQIYQLLEYNELAVCVVPRSKAENAYGVDQQLFRESVRRAIAQRHEFIDGTKWIIRNINTYTTHLGDKAPNYVNDGPRPYPGITENTCQITADIKDKNILLVDDIYTPNVNIDEDAINALLNGGAQSVTFYAVGKVNR